MLLYPVLAFENMTLQDAFWGTRLVLSFTDEQIRAAVETGEFTEPGAAKFLARVLIKRHDKIGRYCLGRLYPVGKFAGQYDSDRDRGSDDSPSGDRVEPSFRLEHAQGTPPGRPRRGLSPETQRLAQI